jgi:hypothetical protein
MRHVDIAAALRISDVTLRKHFRDELDSGGARANAQIIGNIFRQGVKNDFKAIPAARLWAANRLGWTEAHKVEMSGPDGGPIEQNVKHSADESFSRIVDVLNVVAVKKASEE